MPRSYSMARIKCVMASVLHQLQSVQIEHQGQYSVQRLQSLQRYISSQFTSRRLAILLCTTPLPSITIIILIELLPLNPPSAGPHDNSAFWARCTVVNILQAIGFITITQLAVPEIKLSLIQRSIVTICATAVGVGTAYTLSVTIGFPVPFMMTIMSLPLISLMWMLTSAFSFRRVFADTSTSQSLKEWIRVSGLVTTQLFLYPLYNHVFHLATAWQQTALSILLGIVKIGYKYAVGKATKQQADDKAEIVILNAEIGHAMFVTFSMQNATSIITVLVLLLIDLLHSSSVVYDVHIMIQQLKSLDQAIRVNEMEPPQDKISVVDRATSMISRYHIDHGPSSRAIKSLSWQSASENTKIKNHCLCGRLKPFKRISTARIHLPPSMDSKPETESFMPTLGMAPLHPKRKVYPHSKASENLGNTSNDSFLQRPLNAAEVEYIVTTRRLLHLTEFTMLGELVEVVVPIIYTAYTYAMIYLPNRMYCSQLADISTNNIGYTALRMLLYGLLELLSLVLIDWVLRYQLYFSPVAQLAMVLDNHWTFVQAGLNLWALYTVQGLLQHNGTDFSFKFAWLHSNTTGAISV